MRTKKQARAARTAPPHTSGSAMMGSDRADAWALAFAMAFLSGWADVLCVARYQTFVGQLTGNVIYFGLSLAPPARRRDAGVTDDPALYLCVIVANIAGAGLFQFLKRSSDRPGAALAVLSVLSMLAGDLVFALVSRSPWCALFFAPCFGALNALSSGPPLSTSVVTMTANSQKIPDWLFKCRDDQKLLPVPLGAVMPFPALLGAAGSAALLWANNSRWVFSVWSSVPVFVGTAGLLVLHDSLAARIAQRNSTNPRV